MTAPPRAAICGGCRGMVRHPAVETRPGGWLLLITPSDSVVDTPPEILLCSTDCAERWLQREGQQWRL